MVRNTNISDKRIVLIGAGNVGYHLGQRMRECGLSIVQVFSRSRKKAGKLARTIGVPYTTQLQRINPDADLYILAVHDDAIATVASSLAKILPPDKLLAHTSGATPLSALGQYFQTTGIFYPLQSFSVDRPADFSQLPICVFSNQQASLQLLQEVAEKICPNVYVVNDEQRAALHVAAVFVNNFANHLFHIGEQISQQHQVPFDLLKPLIRETVNKIQQHAPQQMQTGPAIRGDQQTIKRHLQTLKDFPEYQEIYRLMTESIDLTTKK